jgi:hypothetical protein
MLIIKNEDYHTTFEKNILNDGRCQVVIRHDALHEWLFDKIFDNEEQADNFLNNNWEDYCKIAEDIYYAGLFAMKKALKRYKEENFY